MLSIFQFTEAIMFREHHKDLHSKATVIKNFRRHQHDGGRAWIKDGQLHEAIKNINPKIVYTKKTSE